MGRIGHTFHGPVTASLVHLNRLWGVCVQISSGQDLIKQTERNRPPIYLHNVGTDAFILFNLIVLHR